METPPNPSRSIGIGALLFAVTFWLPIGWTLLTSFFAYDLMSPPRWAGLRNYAQLAADPVFWTALFNGITLALLRTASTWLVWSLLLAAWRGRLAVPRWLVLLAVAPLPLLMPATTGHLWITGLQAGGDVLFGAVALDAALDARLSLYAVDVLYTLAVASALGLVVYALTPHRLGPIDINYGDPDLIAVAWMLARPDHARQRREERVWAFTRTAALLLAASSGLQASAGSVFSASQGPDSVLITPVRYIYMHAFQQFGFGPASAAATLLLAALLPMGWLLWQRFRSGPIRLAGVKEQRLDQRRPVAFHPVYLLSPLPAVVVCLPFAWLLWQVSLEVPMSMLPNLWQDSTAFMFEWLRRSFIVLLPAAAAIWLVQMPVSLLTGAGLAYRHRSKQDYPLLPFLVVTFVGVAPISVALYSGLRNFGWLNSWIALALPWLTSTLTLLLFLLFFAAYAVPSSPADSQPVPLRKFVMRMFDFPLRPLALLAGVVATFWASQALFWPLLVTFGPPYDLLNQLNGAFLSSTQPAGFLTRELLAPVAINLLAAGLFALVLVILVNNLIATLSFAAAEPHYGFQPTLQEFDRRINHG